jgi:hypothetical protein
MQRDAAQAGTVAGILTVGMLESLRDGEPASPFMGGFIASDRQIIRVPMDDETEMRAFLDGHTDRVAVGCHAEEREISVVDNAGLLYMIQWVRGSGRVFTSEPQRRVREPDLDLVQRFERGFKNVARDFDGWGELGKYGEE